MTNMYTVPKAVQKSKWYAISWWAKFEANAISCPLVQVLEISRLAVVSAEVGLRLPAHISAVQKTFLLHQDCVKILSAKCYVAAKGIRWQPFTWAWQSAFCTGDSWDLPKLTGISASGFSRSLPCKQHACTHMSTHAQTKPGWISEQLSQCAAGSLLDVL